MTQPPKLVVIREQELLAFCLRVQDHGAAGYAIAQLDPTIEPVQQFGGWFQCFMRWSPEPHPEA